MSPVLIKRTGMEEFVPGGTARVKMMTIGGPSVGKTRYASCFPKPIYLDIEGGLASVADRAVPYVTINTSQDMTDALQHLKLECRKRPEDRDFETVVVDTLDAYQRKVKVDWMERNRTDQFTGWEAWGFLSQRMQSLMTKLLNLDMNVIVNVHYKDKVTRDDETKRETHEYMLQLSGEIADSVFNDFDFVGWMEEAREVVDGKPAVVRFISFEKTPQRPFLKDRLNVMQGRVPVTFEKSDYDELIGRITSRLEGLEPSQTLGEIPTYIEGSEPVAGTVSPSQTGSSVLPRREPALESLDKAALQKICKAEGISTGVDGKALRGNALKSELIEAIKHHRSAPQAEPITPPAPEPTPAPQPAQSAPHRENAPAQDVALNVAARQMLQGEQRAPQPTIKTEAGRVNPATGEVLSPAAQPAQPAQPARDPQDPQAALARLKEQYTRAADSGDEAGQQQAEKAMEALYEANPAVATAAAQANVQQVLGGEVIARTQERARVPQRPATPAPSPAPSPAAASAHKYAGDTCDMCGKSLASEPFQPIQLGWIKFRKKLCEAHFVEMRDASARR